MSVPNLVGRVVPAGLYSLNSMSGTEAAVAMVKAAKALALLKDEVRFGGYRLQFARCLFTFVPPYVGNRLRVRVLRRLGFQGIHPNTVFGGFPEIVGRGRISSRLTVGRRCHFNVGCFLDLSDAISIGSNVSIGQQVMFLTESHEVGGSSYRAGKLMSKPIVVGDGCWIGARATILPGVTIGDGAIVAAGSVVNRDVRRHSMVGGVPAKEISDLRHPIDLASRR